MAAEVRRLAADSTQIAEAAVWEYERVCVSGRGWVVRGNGGGRSSSDGSQKFRGP